MGLRTWVKPGGQQLKLNTRKETEQKAYEMGFVPKDKAHERPDINYRIDRMTSEQMQEESRIWLPPSKI